MQKSGTKRKVRPAQTQKRPGQEHLLKAKPDPETPIPAAKRKLSGKVALITGGDSGIGRAVAVAFAHEGADVAIAYLNEHVDARETKEMVEEAGGRCIIIAGDLGREATCRRVVDATVKRFGRIDVLVNNCAIHYPQEELEQITAEQLDKTFRTNVYSYFFCTREALKHMEEGSTIINTTSVTAYRGSAKLIDYSATKGAIVSFTRSLSAAVVERGIRVNAVAPGPIWTPLIASSFKGKKVATFGSDVPMERAGQPGELAPCYVFLASEDSSYMTGQVLHPNGGEIVNG
jgi:NAD(P)-dependent dehydrogenase (short-subunit alcohol dehydrogenase family)